MTLTPKVALDVIVFQDCHKSVSITGPVTNKLPPIPTKLTTNLDLESKSRFYVPFIMLVVYASQGYFQEIFKENIKRCQAVLKINKKANRITPSIIQ